MSSLFEVTADYEQRLLRCRLSGRWTLDTVIEYRDAVGKAAERLFAAGIHRSQINVLVDAREFKPQAQDVVAFYQEQFNRPDMTANKVATIASDLIFRMQAKRVGAEDQRLFESERDALAWFRE